MRLPRLRLVSAAALATTALFGSATRADAAPTFSFNGFLLSAQLDPGSTVVNCDAAGNITFNGTATNPRVPCNTIGQLSFGPKSATMSATRTVDLRAVTTAKFPQIQIGQQSVSAQFTGATTIHGSAFPDFASTGTNGRVFGNAGDDTLFITDPATGAELWGGQGNDALTALDAGTGGRLEGGAGNDIITHQGSSGLVGGGDGSNRLEAYGANVSIFGGSGTDTIITNLVTGGTRVIDAGLGTDRINIRAQGGVFKARTAVDPEPKVSFSEGLAASSAERVETVEVRGAGVQTFDIQMDANTAYNIKPSARPNNVVTIRVPGGVWTVGTTTVTAPGLQTVTWRGTVVLTVSAG